MDKVPITPLQRRREAAGHTRESLAGECELAITTLYGLERLGRRPRRRTANTLAVALGVPVHELWPHPAPPR